MLGKDFKYLLGSLILHLTAVAIISYQSSNSSTEETLTAPIEVSFAEQEGEDKKASQFQGGSNIIPKGDDQILTSDPSKGYYGIGVNTHDYYLDGQFVVEIMLVSSGYPADLAGLQVGDIVTEVDGKPIITGQEIRGDGKTEITLKVKKKNGTIVLLKITRDFIRTEI